MTLRRILLASTVFAVVAGCPAVAQPVRPHTRVLTIAYDQPCVVALVLVHQFTYRGCPAEQSFRVELDERFVSLEIADDSGKPVGISFNLDEEIQPPATLFCGHASRVPIDGAFYVANPAMLVAATSAPTRRRPAPSRSPSGAGEPGVTSYADICGRGRGPVFLAVARG